MSSCGGAIGDPKLAALSGCCSEVHLIAGHRQQIPDWRSPAGYTSDTKKRRYTSHPLVARLATNMSLAKKYMVPWNAVRFQGRRRGEIDIDATDFDGRASSAFAHPEFVVSICKRTAPLVLTDGSERACARQSGLNLRGGPHRRGTYFQKRRGRRKPSICDDE